MIVQLSSTKQGKARSSDQPESKWFLNSISLVHRLSAILIIKWVKKIKAAAYNCTFFFTWRSLDCKNCFFEVRGGSTQHQLMSKNACSLHHYGDIQKHLALKKNIEKLKLVKLMDIQYCSLSFPLFFCQLWSNFCLYYWSPVITKNLMDNIYNVEKKEAIDWWFLSNKTLSPMKSKSVNQD